MTNSDKQFEEQLDQLNVPVVELQSHKRQLRAALLSAHAAPSFKLRSLMKTFFSHKILSSGAMVALVSVIAVTAALGIYPYSLDVDKANAQVVLDSAIQKVQRLSDEERQKLDELLGADPVELLRQARQAGDLSFVGLEEIDFDAIDFSSAGIDQDSLPPRLEQAKIAIFEDANGNELKVLRPPFHGPQHRVHAISFTDDGGKKIQIGVDENGLPITRIITHNEDGTIQVTDENGNVVDEQLPPPPHGFFIKGEMCDLENEDCPEPPMGMMHQQLCEEDVEECERPMHGFIRFMGKTADGEDGDFTMPGPGPHMRWIEQGETAAQ